MHPKFFATANKNKLREASEILGYELEQIELDLAEPQGLDVEEVIRIKAKDAFMKAGKPVLVEDTGLSFEAWNGLPGALIKWFLLSAGIEGILKMLGSETNRGATAKTAVGFYDGNEYHIYTGEVKGTVPTEPRGESGFGWDPIFIPNGHEKSFAQMAAEEKNTVSMRGLALEKLKGEM